MTTDNEIERLRNENSELRILVDQLHKELAAALARIAELEQARKDPPSFVKPNRRVPADPKQPRKKRAPQHNRSRRRQEPTRIEQHALERCPDCNYLLQGNSLHYTREVSDLPPPVPVEVLEHQVFKRFCPHCRKHGTRSAQTERRARQRCRSRGVGRAGASAV